MQNRFTAMLAAGTVVVCVLLSQHLTSATAQDDDQTKRDQPANTNQADTDVSVFMQEKLKSCDQVLRGIATQDHRQIKEAANKLIAMSKRALWRQKATAVYTQDTVDFVANVEFLGDMADAENLSGATLASSQLVVRCADCHSHVRTPKVARLDDPLSPAPAVASR
jgi:hypothetical protein